MNVAAIPNEVIGLKLLKVTLLLTPKSGSKKISTSGISHPRTIQRMLHT